MGIIRVHNIRIHTNHGCMEEEAKIGSDYIVNAEVKTTLDKSAQTDNLADTVDYVAIYTIIFEEMKIRAKLLETVVQRIIDRVLKEHKTVEEVTIEVRKLNPPIGGDVAYVSVERKGKRAST